MWCLPPNVHFNFKKPPLPNPSAIKQFPAVLARLSGLVLHHAICPPFPEVPRLSLGEEQARCEPRASVPQSTLHTLQVAKRAPETAASEQTLAPATPEEAALCVSAWALHPGVQA